VAEGLPLCSIDARAIELLVINLLDNAFKYAKDGGGWRWSVERAGRAVRVAVSDRGPGIDAEDQDRIFERFVRGRNAAGEARVRGSGIGLSLVKHIAESHGGKVRVVSPILDGGRGSLFEVLLPAGVSDAEAAQAGGEGASGTRA
jgi:two-component system phosphate regulon sensor histidine kinase PhoR